MTYPEEQWSGEFIKRVLELEEENARLKDKLSKETLNRESAEKKYFDLCERCMNLYVTTKDIYVDSLLVQVNVPRFMSGDDFATGISQHLISILNAERERAIFNRTNTDWCKPIE